MPKGIHKKILDNINGYIDSFGKCLYLAIKIIIKVPIKLSVTSNKAMLKIRYFLNSLIILFY